MGISKGDDEMTSDEKISYLWNHHYECALGCSHPAPFDYADSRVAAWKARQTKEPRPAYRGPRAGGSRAGLRQYRERQALHT